MNRILKSQLIVSLCALALGAETYLVTGIPASPIELALIFFSTLLIYNIAQLRLNISKKPFNKIRLSLFGDRMNVIISILAVLITVPLVSLVNIKGQSVFLLTSLAAMAYVMPFSYKGSVINGLRGIPVIKNILLSIVWALGTISIPVEVEDRR